MLLRTVDAYDGAQQNRPEVVGEEDKPSGPTSIGESPFQRRVYADEVGVVASLKYSQG